MPFNKSVHYNKKYIENEIRALARQQVVAKTPKSLKPVTPILERADDVLTQTY